MNKKIAILGCGTAGIHLAYELLSKPYFEVTIFTKETAEEIRSGRVRSTQVHFSPALTREERYHMPNWQEAKKLHTVHISVGGKTLFSGHLDNHAQSVDQRLYFSECMNDLEQKGVHFVYQKVTADQLTQLAESYDLIVDCTGRSGPVAPFQLNRGFEQPKSPLRKCSAGYFHGVRHAEPAGIIAHIIPGEGELFEIPAYTEHGQTTVLFVEAIPGGKLDVFNRVRHAIDFKTAMIDLTESFFPEIRERMDLEVLDLCDEQAFIRTAIRPKVHLPYCTVNGKTVIGCGDSVILNDPITGQGDNTASFVTEQLFLSLIEDLDSGWNEATAEKYWERIKPYVTHVIGWSNAMMKPLPDHVLGMIMQGAEDSAVAAHIAKWFEHPTTAYNDFFEKNGVLSQ
ncbi:2-polyprenyl-6-methoxyphenol hydroxylase-like FAD-dependent oxidoreductase [Scopulibacillus darangshiensis]|uniref:2-polyprenyl-6-methoxyphenol hydroxylase-like FAD-dependent oxidoreductase n=1 Tax=Scopulibacillus darangshiensis TaxID=442528 RepID=A0A4R2P6H5_9BACL|nr:styrene monooxygenase/indole monooxygenase family protein [Scopulibacillus darangshiensis]TCP29395.1 2-polyprenyl-6-methoxyphenol hydroxylase-like FAD-dependent oxidoreductase [Scopulibacillus darangshiensis]